MEYLRLEVEGDLSDHSLSLIEAAPEGMGIDDFRLALGETAKDFFPINARITLQDTHPGIRLGGLLGNLCGFLIISREAKEVIQELCPDQNIEFFCFTLYNHKNRVHTRDYYFVNPVGGIDCVSEEASEIQYASDGYILVIEELVLSKGKLKNAPHLFRIDKDMSTYVISETLRDAWKNRGITNIVTTPLKIHDDEQGAFSYN